MNHKTISDFDELIRIFPIVNLTLAVFLAFAVNFMAGGNVYSAGECDNCPLRDLCIEAVLDAELSFCDDPRYKKYFEERKEAELLTILQKAAAAERSKGTAEISLNPGGYEVTVENRLITPARSI